jgi:uncharacterized protein YbjT (DUF2867 family)/ribosome-associated protein YbcJ (S4-like RNA binding protein)
LQAQGCELWPGDLTDEQSLRGAAAGAEAGYFLMHAMADGPGFAEREHLAAANFARLCQREGVRRVIYLGGLGEESASIHLQSRQRTAEVLAAEGPPLTYFRAAMVVGARSESYRTLRHLVKRLPVMIAPAWLRIATQPIAVDDVVAYLLRAPEIPESAAREVQIGGPDVLSYGDMLDRMAVAMGVRPRPRVPVPLITPWLSALWLGLVTPVDTNVARPLVEGLTTETIVTDTSGAALFAGGPAAIDPISFDEALRRALAEDARAERSIRGETIRLGQLLKLADVIDSGSDARSLLAEQPAIVNGETETRRGRQLHVGDVVHVADEELVLVSATC